MKRITDQIHEIITAHTQLVLNGAVPTIVNDSTTEVIRELLQERDTYLLGKAYNIDIKVAVKNLAHGLVQVDQETKNIMRDEIHKKMQKTL